MTVSTIGLYSGTVPDPFTQEAPVFSVNAVAWTTYQANTLVDDFNTAVGEFNADVIIVNNDVAASAASAATALLSAEAAETAANFLGEWSTLTGAKTKGATVLNNGVYWALLVDIADITLSEPAPTNADWAFKSGTRWIQATSSLTVPTNSQVLLTSTTAATDLNATIPVMAVNDFVVVSNSSTSTEMVRLVNNSYTIFGKKGSITNADDFTIRAGDTAHLVARTSTILEAV